MCHLSSLHAETTDRNAQMLMGFADLILDLIAGTYNSNLKAYAAIGISGNILILKQFFFKYKSKTFLQIEYI